MEHAELVAEMPHVEKLQTQERLKHARKRREQQLKAWTNYERRLDKEATKGGSGKQSGGTAGGSSAHFKTANGATFQPKNRVDFGEMVSLLEAASRNDIEEVRLLLESGVDPNAANQDGLSALHQCCIDNSPAILQLLVQYGADVNRRDAEMWTPLHAAATCAHLELCRILIDNGAELLALNADGNMPYDVCDEDATLDYIESEMAKRGITQEMIDDMRLQPERDMIEDLQRRFKESGANVATLETPDARYGASPLHIAAANGYVRVAEFLLENNAQVDHRDNDGWTALHAAACWANADLVEMLVMHGADLDATNRYGETPADVCDDPAIKQRMVTLGEEQKQARASGRTGRLAPQGSQLSRHRGGSFRGSIVRRSSMREKRELHRRDVEQERFQVMPSGAPDPDASTPSSDRSQETGGGAPTGAAAPMSYSAHKFLPVPGAPAPNTGDDYDDSDAPVTQPLTSSLSNQQRSGGGGGISAHDVTVSVQQQRQALVPVPPMHSPGKSILRGSTATRPSIANGEVGGGGDNNSSWQGGDKPENAQRGVAAASRDRSGSSSKMPCCSGRCSIL